MIYTFLLGLFLADKPGWWAIRDQVLHDTTPIRWIILAACIALTATLTRLVVRRQQSATRNAELLAQLRQERKERREESYDMRQEINRLMNLKFKEADEYVQGPH